MADQTPTDMRDLHAIADDRLKPCAGCGANIVPTFWMICPVRCVVDDQGRRERAGLHLMLGSPALASTFAGTPAAREFDQLPELCICETCACTMPLAALALKD